MKTIALLIISLFQFSLQTFSQERQIQARIIDDSSNKPVSFVTIYSSPATGVISDEAGFFRFNYFEEQHNDSLYFSCIGYGAKSVAISDLSHKNLDTVFMTPQVFHLHEALVESKSRKTPKSKHILKEAIAAIPENHPDFPVKYNGYYREYIKHNEDYINLIESIIELSDSGINNLDHFAAGLRFKRSSPDFATDPALMRPYDNVNKFVPYLWAPNTTSNELVLLRNHDPVRNFDQKTLYHINNLESEFVKNHEFLPPRLTYLDDIPYYSISFSNKKPVKKGGKALKTEGVIFVSAVDYGIKRLSYEAFAEEGINRRKLFGLNLEYKLQGKLYYLNYLSFNNLFMIRNFAISDAHVHEGRVDLTFNQAFDTTDLKLGNFRVFWKDRELDVSNIEVVPDSNLIRLAVNGTEDIQSEHPQQDLELTNPEEGSAFDRDEFVSKHLGFEIANMTDLYGNPLVKAGFREYYQYRELFVRDFRTENTLVSNNLINLLKPVFETRIFGESTTDNSWINTPLIEEDYNANLVKLENPKHQSGVENLLSRNERIINEMVYIHTDREMYAPSDTIWFKAYVREMEKLDTSALSQTLFLKLVNEEGRTIEKVRYLIEGSDTHGQFILDHKLDEGIYYLTAFSSWMQNFGTDQVIVKKILIRKDRRPELQMELVLDRSVYFPGDTVTAVAHCYDELNRDVENVKYSYRVSAGKKQIITEGRTRTSTPLQDSIIFVVPEQLPESPFITFSGTHKGQVLDTLYRLPVIRNIHVDFFPEGGNSINGLESIIAFKAQTLQGDPIHIQGEIVDLNGKVITKTLTEYGGMGSFKITPARDKQLYLHLTDPPGFDTLYPLPLGLDNGWLLSGTATGDEIFLDVKRQETANDIALLTVMVRGHLSHYEQIRVKKNETIRIPLLELPAGIAVVTLFDHNMNPRAERLFYINPEGEPEILVESNRSTFVPRDKVTLDIKLSNPLSETLTGSYSLSVVDEQLGFTDFLREPNIRSSFLLSPEIKGIIHNPNYYMDLDKSGVRHHLDLLLMTQGWRSYSYVKEVDWKQEVLKPKDQEMISGTLFKQPFVKEEQTSAGNINVFFGGSSVKIPVNENGRFSFTPEYDPRYNSGILISGETDPPSPYAMLRVDEPNFRKGLKDYLELLTDSLARSTNIPLLPYKSIADQFSLGLTYYQWIEEVEIVKTRNTLDHDAYNSVIEDFIVMNKRQSGPEDIEGAIDLIGILYNMGIPIEYQQDSDMIMHLGYPRAPITFVVDGSIYGTKFSFVENFVPASIEKVFFVKGVETMYYGPNMTEVVVSIKLKRFDPNDEYFDPFLSKYNVPKFEVSKEFYKPLYNTEEKRKSMIPDLRKTIHWDPDLQIGEDGNVSVQFYNGDRYTKVKCVLEGITHEGVPIYQEYYYNVSLSRD